MLQILAFTVWPLRHDTFSRLGWLPFFLFLWSASFLWARWCQTPARKLWMKSPRKGSWTLLCPTILALILCVAKGIQQGIQVGKSESAMPKPYLRLERSAFQESRDATCISELYESSVGMGGIDVALNWTTSLSGLVRIINPFVLKLDGTMAVRAARPSQSLKFI